MHSSTVALLLLLPLVRVSVMNCLSCHDALHVQAQNYGYNPQNQQPVNQFDNYPSQDNNNNMNFPIIRGPDGKPVPQGPGPAMVRA